MTEGEKIWRGQGWDETSLMYLLQNFDVENINVPLIHNR